MDIKEFFEFKDWINLEEHKNRQWIVVARCVEHKSNKLFTTSFLAKTTSEKDLNKFIKNDEWIINLYFGLPTIIIRYDKKQILDMNNKDEFEGIEIEPFIIRQNFHGIANPKFTIIQNFILYHNLYFIKEEKIYRKIDLDGIEYDVMKIEEEENYEEISINTKHLKEYIADREMSLIRQHEHKRFTEENIKDILNSKERIELEIKDESKYYTIFYMEYDIPTNLNAFSMLRGKDIVKPYTKDTNNLFLYKEEEKKYCNFIIGIDDNGNEIEETCNSGELNNYFRDIGKPHFLTPVFFAKDVLKKYYDNPRKYEIKTRYISCLDLWGIPYDINKNDIVYVWLGDLDRLPYKEQLHWKQYNLLPEGGITEHRFKSDFLAEFSETDEPLHLFKTAFNNIQELFNDKFGFDLLLQLSKDDLYCSHTLHIPTSNEQMELDQEILKLAKVLVDSLNKKYLNKKTENTIDSFENFLNQHIEKTSTSKIIKSFRNLQTFRSSIVAHRKSRDMKKYNNILDKLGIKDLKNIDKFKKILGDITWSLNKIFELLN